MLGTGASQAPLTCNGVVLRRAESGGLNHRVSSGIRKRSAAEVCVQHYAGGVDYAAHTTRFLQMMQGAQSRFCFSQQLSFESIIADPSRRVGDEFLAQIGSYAARQ